MEKFIMVIRPSRPGFPADATEAESAVIGQHFEYLKQHFDAGRVVYVGRTTDEAPFGLAIWQGENADEVEAHVAADPAVQAGIFTAEVRPFAEIMR